MSAFGILRRRTSAMVVVIGLGCLVALIWASRPLVYHASEALQIVPTAVAPELVRSTVGDLTVQRMDLARQRVVTRDGMLAIISAYGVYADQPDLTPDEKVERLRQAVRFDLDTSKGGQSLQKTPALIVSAWLPDPEQARNVAHELGHRMVLTTTRMRIDEATAILGFVAGREAQLIKDKQLMERRIVELGSGGEQPDTSPVQEKIVALRVQVDHLVQMLQTATAQRFAAESSLELERQRLADRLTVIDPALVPDGPVRGRGETVFSVAALSLLAAVILALVLEWRDPVLGSARRMQKTLGIKPLAEIPVLRT